MGNSLRLPILKRMGTMFTKFTMNDNCRHHKVAIQNKFKFGSSLLNNTVRFLVTTTQRSHLFSEGVNTLNDVLVIAAAIVSEKLCSFQLFLRHRSKVPRSVFKVGLPVWRTCNTQLS